MGMEVPLLLLADRVEDMTPQFLAAMSSLALLVGPPLPNMGCSSLWMSFAPENMLSNGDGRGVRDL